MILDNFLGYREAQTTALGLSVADKWPKDESLNHGRNAWTVVPDANLQAGWITRRGNHDPPRRVRRNRLACIQDEVGNHSLEEIGIEPTNGSSVMMMRDIDASEIPIHTCEPDCAPDCVKNVSDTGTKRVSVPGTLHQCGDQLIHSVDCPTDFLVDFGPFRFADG
jgi:hypothetical protein